MANPPRDARADTKVSREEAERAKAAREYAIGAVRERAASVLQEQLTSGKQVDASSLAEQVRQAASAIEPARHVQLAAAHAGAVKEEVDRLNAKAPDRTYHPDAKQAIENTDAYLARMKAGNIDRNAMLTAAYNNAAWQLMSQDPFRFMSAGNFRGKAANLFNAALQNEQETTHAELVKHLVQHGVGIPEALRWAEEVPHIRKSLHDAADAAIQQLKTERAGLRRREAVLKRARRYGETGNK